MEQSRSYPANPAFVTATSPTASQSSHTTAHTTTTTNKKRKASGGTGSRGVANLTPEQLSKKRANDREAQRAIRERTKGQIEQLQKQIKELTDQKPYQELQDVVRQKELVEAQNEDIKRRLANVMSILQPLCALHYLDPSQVQFAGLGIQNPLLSPEATSTRYSNQPTAAIGAHEAKSAGSTSSTYAPSPQARNAVPSSPYTSQPAGYSPTASLGRRHGSIGHQPVATQSPVADEKLELGYLLRRSRQNSGEHRQLHGNPRGSVERTPPAHSFQPKSAPTLSPFQNGSDDYPPIYAYTSKTIDQTCPLDGLLLKFLSDQRERLVQGEPINDVIGPPYPSFRTLLEPWAGEKSHPLSKVFTDMLEKFPDISTLPEKAAILYVMFTVMRWQIHPSPETYDRLPDWMTIRPSQLFAPHPAWVDYLPWPRMRDKLTRIYPSIPFDEFFIPYTTTVSLNWPLDDRTVLTKIVDSEELTLTPPFERHLMELGNWTLGERFARAHPQLADTFKMGMGKNRHP